MLPQSQDADGQWGRGGCPPSVPPRGHAATPLSSWQFGALSALSIFGAQWRMCQALGRVS